MMGLLEGRKGAHGTLHLKETKNKYSTHCVRRMDQIVYSAWGDGAHTLSTVGWFALTCDSSATFVLVIELVISLIAVALIALVIVVIVKETEGAQFHEQLTGAETVLLVQAVLLVAS